MLLTTADLNNNAEFVVGGWLGALAVATMSNLNLMLGKVDVGLGFDNKKNLPFVFECSMCSPEKG